MTKVEALYNKYAEDRYVEKANSGKISENIKRMYEKCKSRLNNKSLEMFAACVANFSPGQCSIGEKAQLCVAKDKLPLIKKLPPTGKDSIKLYRQQGELSVKRGNFSSNINGIKSFDGIYEDVNKITLFVLKTIDLGEFTDSKGGGHQRNVLIELTHLISTIGESKLIYDSKDVEIIILIDGRLSNDFIQKCRKCTTNTAIRIMSSEDL